MSAPWIDSYWQAAVLPDRWDVCGLTCRSLTLWHLMALEHVGCRYLVGGSANMDDAAALLMIASRDYLQGKALFINAAFREAAIRKAHTVLNGQAWADVDAACREYVEACTRAPRRWKKEGASGKSARVAYQWHLVNAMLRGNVSLVEAWNTPYAIARCLYDVQAEAAGDDSLMSAEHERIDDKMSAEKEAECPSSPN